MKKFNEIITPETLQSRLKISCIEMRKWMDRGLLYIKVDDCLYFTVEDVIKFLLKYRKKK